MMQLPFVCLDGILYTFAKYIEDMAAEIGPYKVYEYDKKQGDGHTGPRHPGTVVMHTIKKVCNDYAIRKMCGVLPTDFGKLEFGVHQKNDDVVNWLIYQKIITKYDMNMNNDGLNVFNKTAAQAVIQVLNKNMNLHLSGDMQKVLAKEFTGCVISPLRMQPKEQRPRSTLF